MSHAGHFRTQAGWCERLGSPFTARLLEQAADDIERDGVVADLTRDWPGDPRSDALALRLAGALHAAVLTGRDERLAKLYPAPDEAWDLAKVWEAAADFLARDADWVRDFMQSPPQTNEVGRSCALAAAFLWLAKQAPAPFHILELGASAGLNLNWDRFRFAEESWGRTAGDGPLIATEIEGAPPSWRDVGIATRAACDQTALNPDEADARMRLQAYVWADQFDRLDRLRAAIDVARSTPWRVEAADAGDWLEARLDGELPKGMSVIYHSIFLQYPDETTRRTISDVIEAAGRRAAPERQQAWVRFEPESVLGGPANSERFVLNAIVWDGRERRERELGEADPHGRRLRWTAGPG